jgi:alpha-tubulin suppressor-like RCC1 family protein
LESNAILAIQNIDFMKALLTTFCLCLTVYAQAQLLAGGDGHSLMLCDNGEVRAFGAGGWGQLGDGNSSNQSTPVLTLGLPPVVQIACGGNHSLALTENGDVYAWGANDIGQAGTGAPDPFYLLPVLLETIDNVIQIEAGLYMSVALKSDGTVWAWGRNDSGNLGNASYENSSVPVQVQGLNNVVQIGAGPWHVFALTTGGELYGWGQNNFAVLGLGSNFPPTYNTPQLVNIADVMKIDAGYNHSIALKEDGTVWTWGDDTFGQLGQGGPGFANAPIIVPGLENIVDISSGNSHMQVLDDQGIVYVWGYNDYGQVGNGNNTFSNTPSTPLGLGNVVLIASGTWHSLCITDTGDLIGYGRNDGGQLATGNTENSNVPVVGNNDCETIDVNDSGIEDLMSLYPNPSESIIYLEFPAEINANAAYSIYSGSGQLVKSAKLENSGKTIEINLNSLPSGIYLVQMLVDGSSFTRSFIKQ